MALIDQTDLEVKLERWKTMVRGTTPTWTFTATDDSGAVNISGYEITVTAKEDISDDDGDAVFQKTVGDGVTLSTPLSGIFTVTLTSADTESLPDEECELWFDIQMISGAGANDTPFRKILMVVPDVTQTNS